MRSNIFILAILTCCVSVSQAAVRFTASEWSADVGLALPRLADSVAHPVDLPRAEAFLVTVQGKSHLEDRFDAFDLWTSLTVRGRWRDRQGNELTLARLVAAVPKENSEAPLSRLAFRKVLKPLDVKNAALRDEAVNAVLAPIELGKPERIRREGRRNFLEILRYPCSESGVCVYAFRPRSPEPRENPDWYVAVLTLAENENAEEGEEAFSDYFLEEIFIPAQRARTGTAPKAFDDIKGRTETDLLREDYARSVVNYTDWHFLAAGDLLVCDNLDDTSRGNFLMALTNDLPRLRQEYVRAVPSQSFDAFHPAAFRVFASRTEYLTYLGQEAQWTAAVWSPLHRELVLYLPPSGTKQLLRTVWHEAFHQYLAYASSMLVTPPWFNEGHAEFFEHTHLDAEGALARECPADYANYIRTHLDEHVMALPALLNMDYEQFYAGTPQEREAKYRLAWSIIYFLEVGAPQIRFRPYETLRGDLVDALVRLRTVSQAQETVLPPNRVATLIANWREFWSKE